MSIHNRECQTLVESGTWLDGQDHINASFTFSHQTQFLGHFGAAGVLTFADRLNLQPWVTTIKEKWTMIIPIPPWRAKMITVVCMRSEIVALIDLVLWSEGIEPELSEDKTTANTVSEPWYLTKIASSILLIYSSWN